MHNSVRLWWSNPWASLVVYDRVDGGNEHIYLDVVWVVVE